MVDATRPRETTVGVERRTRVERVIWRFRAGAGVFGILQTLQTPDDQRLASGLLVAVFVLSVVVARPLLTGSPSPRTVGRVGAGSMVLDTIVIVSLMATNMADPAEPIYLVVVFGSIEAALRWSLIGGVVAGLISGLVTAGWTVAVYVRAGEPVDVSYATMRGSVLLIVGIFIGAIIQRLNDERRVLERTLDVSRDLIATIDEQGTILTVNAACRDLVGFEPDELIGRNYRDFMLSDGPPPVPGAAMVDRIRQGAFTALYERRFRCADGSLLWLELSVTSVTGEHVAYVVGRDITERREVAQRLAASEQRFRSLFEHSPDAVYAFDLDGRFTAVNPATEAMSGYRFAELAEMSMTSLIEGDHLGRTLHAFEQAAAGAAQTFDTVLRTSDGRRIDLHVTNLPIVVDDEVVGVYGVAKDVTDRRQLERQLGRQARHDALTGLPNRFALEELLATLVAGERSVGAGVLFIDLDRFKVVNDSLGHRSGDVLLIAVAERLQSCLRTGDVLVRWAGDEFCAVLPASGHPEVAVSIAERALAVLKQPFALAGREVRVSASIGVAVAPGAANVDLLVQHADLAMYEAKRAGRDRISVYEPGWDRGVRSRLDLEVELRQALRDGDLTLVYQPIVELCAGVVVGMEALARWPQPDGSTRPPDDFICMAEETGLIRQLTRWALSEACGQLAEWDAIGCDGGDPLAMAVNISALDLAAPTLVDEVAVALEQAGIVPHRLVLEVTERMLVEDVAAVETIEGLRGLGVHLSVDDFGTGYSSLSRLHNLAVSSFKIDRAFLEGVGPGSRGALMIATLVDLGEAFGLAVVAEGVERPDQLAALIEAGCRFGQGHYFARPGTPEDVWPLVHSRRVDLPAAGCGLGPRVDRVRVAPGGKR